MASARERGFWFAIDLHERAITPLAMGKAEQFFRMVAIGQSGGIAMIIGNAILNAAQPRRVQITDPGGLNRRRTLRKNAQIGHAGVAGEVDQDVYAVAIDLVGHIVGGYP